MKEKKSINVNFVLDRIKQELDINRDTDLGSLLEVKQTTFSSWRSRDTMDYKRVVEFVREHGMDVEYILFGTEIIKEKESNNALSLLTGLVAEQLQPQLSKQNELYEKLLFMLEKEDIRRQLEEAREKTESKIDN